MTSILYGIRIFIQIPALIFLARYLGASNYGLFAALSALAVALGHLSGLGTGFLVFRESVKDSHQGQALLSSSIRLVLFASILLFPVYVLLVRSFFGLNEAVYLYILIGITEILVIPISQLLYQRTRGVGRVILSQSYTLLILIFRLAGLLFCIIMTPDQSLLYYANAYAISSVIALFVIGMLTMRYADWHFDNTPISIAVILRAAPYGIMRFMNQTPSELDKPLALRLLPATDAGIYSIASRGLLFATIPSVAIITSAQPRLISHWQNDLDATRHLIKSILLSSFLIGLFALAGLFLMAPLVVSYVLGPSFSSLQAWLPLFAGVAPFMAVRQTAGGILVALDKPTVRTLIEAASLLLILTIGSALGYLYGMIGLICALYVSEATGALIMLVTLHRALWRQS